MVLNWRSERFYVEAISGPFRNNYVTPAAAAPSLFDSRHVATERAYMMNKIMLAFPRSSSHVRVCGSCCAAKSIEGEENTPPRLHLSSSSFSFLTRPLSKLYGLEKSVYSVAAAAITSVLICLSVGRSSTTLQ